MSGDRLDLSHKKEMNKYQEAFANVKRACMVPFLGRKPIDVCGVSLDRLKELVERATPKKAIKTHIDIPMLGECLSERYNAYECPNCGKQIDDDYAGFERPDYCMHCGQAIDWSMKDEQTI